MTVYLPLFVALVGVMMYALSTNAKVARIGEIMFAAGLLAFLIPLGSHAIKPLG